MDAFLYHVRNLSQIIKSYKKVKVTKIGQSKSSRLYKGIYLNKFSVTVSVFGRFSYEVPLHTYL